MRYAALQPGETVLDLGSGGGIDTLLSAQAVGSSGQAIGLDMTDAMLERARQHARLMGLANVEFRYGTMEEMPIPNASIGVVISNGVINLSTKKGRVFSECFRVLHPGGPISVRGLGHQWLSPQGSAGE